MDKHQNFVGGKWLDAVDGVHPLATHKVLVLVHGYLHACRCL